jgi:branched-chain amino acid aminotransferase
MNTLEKDLSHGAAWMRGEIIPTSEAAIPVTDWGLTHSDITYDVVHAWEGRFFRLDDYLTRFEASLQKFQLSIDQSRNDIRQILHSIVSKAQLQHSYVSFVASRGQPTIPGSRDPRDCANHFYAWCVPFIWVFSEEVQKRGAHLNMPDGIHRIGSSSIDPLAKNYHWGDFTKGLIHAKDSGYDNTVLLDAQGLLTEGPGFNVFIVKDNKVATPRYGVLGGITRKIAIEMCQHHQLPVEEKDISAAELMDADEVFVTTTGGGVVSVSRINGHVFSNDAPGELTKQLRDTYWKWHNDPSMSEAINYG